MGAVTVKVDASGKLVVPKETLEALGIPDGGELRLTAEDAAGEANAIGPDTVAELRALVRPWRRPSGSGVEELLLERQLEAALESFDIPEARRLRAAIAAARG
ncbi:MAG: AbrB/MazE/SpoVT family DNA-binding domain-containing protein [Acetobacteraceae bacterium]|nr:AbrB/MazE/SpoVT family DNA-binding domain-containing protein [Acetobacteraceae bacterium]